MRRAYERWRTARGCAQATVVALLVLLGASGAAAQELPGIPSAAEEEAPAVDPTSPDAIASRLDGVETELEAIDNEISGAAEERAAYLQAARQDLERLRTLLERELALTRPAEATDAEEPPQAEASPFALNDLYEARFALEADATEREARIDAAREALAASKDQLEDTARARRDARSALKGATDAAGRAAAERTLERREIAHRLAEETVHLRTLEARAAVRARESGPDPDRIGERIEALRAALGRGEGDSRPGFAALVEREAELRRRREAASRRLASAELRLQAAQNRFAQQAQPPPALLAEAEALTANRDAIGQKIALIDAQVERLAAQRETWKRWEALLRGGPSPEELEAWDALAAERIEALERAALERAGRITDLTTSLEGLEARRADVEAPHLGRALDDQIDTLRGLGQQLRAESQALAADRRLSERFRDDIHDRAGRIDPLEYLARGAGTVRNVWTYEITTVDDAPIKVGSLVLALFLFSIGLWAARRGSAFVARVSEDRFKLEAGAAHALQTLSFYALLVGFALLALRAVHFPLTAFTVLGGALAIGIGFGSQNVMNNFISGLILMLERPVRARDVVEIDGNHGTIENIGARSTQIRSTDGRHIIVPNSFFLESNVVNWTRSDDLMRAKVSVGVIYGSPTRLVEKLINQVVEEDADVLKHPAPIIIFEEFGDNSLNFDVYFWVKARSPMAMKKVQSRVRFRIDDLFREDNLVIAFPQRDVHLDSATPIEVRVLNESGDQPSPVER